MTDTTPESPASYERVSFWFRFVVLYEVRRFWEQRGVWILIRLIPRNVKKWIVVQSAVKARWNGHPTDVTYKEMVEVYE